MFLSILQTVLSALLQLDSGHTREVFPYWYLELMQQARAARVQALLCVMSVQRNAMPQMATPGKAILERAEFFASNILKVCVANLKGESSVFILRLK